ncbi:hypothetical protein [Raineyella sp. W15-4]|uniref:hypothetical protein n=1 Tax=Raineyella sp. W15-4 TaxID=3081651 RepID=UPI00295499B6|nr:hypothetical protein [Raineyella sp. W15-4]WOQ18758.1 hypothetical protein R0145_08860 [Raineyella sp. W15-4]
MKGTLWCGACFRRDGSIRRMIVRRTIARNGDEYLYYFCRGTQDGLCDAKYSNLQRIERAVEEHYRTVQFSPDFLQAMRQTLADALADQEASQRALKEQLDGHLARLDAQEANLLDLIGDVTIPRDMIRARLREIGTSRERITAQLNATTDSLTDAIAFIEANLQLLENPYELYLNASDEVRRRLNQAIFKRIFIDHDEIIDHDLEDPLGDLFTVQTIYHATLVGAPPGDLPAIAQHTWNTHHPTKKGAVPKDDSFTSRALKAPAPVQWGAVCSKPHKVGLTGFEPATP